MERRVGKGKGMEWEMEMSKNRHFNSHSYTNIMHLYWSVCRLCCFVSVSIGMNNRIGI